MITLLKKTDYKESLWKNGKGKTSEIAIYPKSSTLKGNDFLWRISSAEVNHSDWFSLFPGYERKLVIWKGAELLLNNKPLLQNIPLTFSGDENIFCEVINNLSVVDLGIIYKNDLVKIDFKVLNKTSPFELSLEKSLSFLFLAHSENDECLIADQHLMIGDCLRIEDEKSILINSNSISVIFYHIKISGI